MHSRLNSQELQASFNKLKCSLLPLLPKLEELDALRTDSVLVLQPRPLSTPLPLSRWHLLPRRLMYRGYLVSPGLVSLLWPPFAGRVGAGEHDLELFLEAGLVDLFLFEFLLKGDDVVEGSEPVAVDVLLAGLPQVEIAVLPEGLLGLGLIHLLPGVLQVLEEHSALGDEHLNDLPELLGVLFAEIPEQLIVALHSIFNDQSSLDSVLNELFGSLILQANSIGRLTPHQHLPLQVRYFSTGTLRLDFPQTNPLSPQPMAASNSPASGPLRTGRRPFLGQNLGKSGRSVRY